MKTRTLAAALTAGTLLAASSVSGAQAWTFKVIHNFCGKTNCVDGADPNPKLVMDSAGNLYGTTLDGGKDFGGVAFQLVPNADHSKWNYNVLFNLPGESDSPLIIDTAGNLYSTLFQGGANIYGLAFELVRPQDGSTKWKFRDLHDFCQDDTCSDGRQPEGGFTYVGAASGAAYDGVSPLYGSTALGNNGFTGAGVVYQLTPKIGTNKWKEKVIYYFCSQANCADGVTGSLGAPVADSSGDLFGTTKHQGANGQGTIYELVPNARRTSWTETTLYSFCAAAGCSDGAQGRGDMLLDSEGNLFGGTGEGGTGCPNGSPPGCGVAFKLVPQGLQSQYTPLYAFCQQADCADGNFPVPGFAEDDSGTVFGATFAGGGHDNDLYGVGGGIVFALNGSSLQVLHAFCADDTCSDGQHPRGGLIRDSSGNLFGVTDFGGKNANGVVYELMP